MVNNSTNANKKWTITYRHKPLNTPAPLHIQNMALEIQVVEQAQNCGRVKSVKGITALPISDKCISNDNTDINKQYKKTCIDSLPF